MLVPPTTALGNDDCPVTEVDEVHSHRRSSLIRHYYLDRILVADAISARDLRQLYDRNIAAVVDLAANEPPAVLGRDLIYCRFPLHDDGSNDTGVLSAAIHCVADLLELSRPLVVACSAGMSRSPTIAAAAVALRTDEPFVDCLQRLTSGTPRDLSPAFVASVADLCRPDPAILDG